MRVSNVAVEAQCNGAAEGVDKLGGCGPQRAACSALLGGKQAAFWLRLIDPKKVRSANRCNAQLTRRPAGALRHRHRVRGADADRHSQRLDLVMFILPWTVDGE